MSSEHFLCFPLAAIHMEILFCKIKQKIIWNGGFDLERTKFFEASLSDPLSRSKQLQSRLMPNDITFLLHFITHMFVRLRKQRSQKEQPCITIYSYNPGQNPLGQDCNIHIFLSFLASLLKQCIVFEIFWQFSSPPLPLPIQSWKKWEKILDTCIQYCLWGEGRGWTCVNWKMPLKRKRPKTFVHDCRLANLSFIIVIYRVHFHWTW